MPSRAADLHRRLSDLLDPSGGGNRVDRILDILFENEELRQWALRFLESSKHPAARRSVGFASGGPAPAALPPTTPGDGPALPPRFVNVCFTAGPDGAPIPSRTALVADTPYCLRIDIGGMSPDSVVENAGANPFPSEALPPSEHGHWLQVAVAPGGFRMDRRRYDLYLPNSGASWVCPCRPNAAHRCRKEDRKRYLGIPVRTAVYTKARGVDAMRIAIYFQNNLVQSQLLRAHLTAREDAPSGGGHSSVIDYTLSADFTGLAAFPRRDLHILTNANDDGSHRIVINSDLNDAVVFNMSDGQVRNAIDEVRTVLRSIHIEETGGSWGTGKQIRNRYDRNNAKSRGDFVADLLQLAPLGWVLWVSLMQDKPEERASLNSLLAPPSLIQVSRVARSGFVFPWALVYDIPLESDPKSHKPCKVLEAWPAALAQIDMRSPMCPFQETHDLNTICPFGFWGIRHVIEQPPSMPKGRNLPLSISCRKNPAMVVGVSLELEKGMTEAHMAQLARLGARLTLQRCDTRNSIRDALSAPALETVYFYCHGLREALASGGTPLPKIGIGSAEGIAPGDIIAWDLGWSGKTAHWRDTSPLVFINGCHTAELTPELLVNFVDAFAGVYAAGVVGTEVTLHQQLANEASETFFLKFWAGSGLGESLRFMRLQFLGKGNLMGLAYTPYCSAELKLADLTQDGAAITGRTA